MTLESTSPSQRRALPKWPTVLLSLIVLLGGALLCLALVRDSRRRTQWKSDPAVATVWVIGVTRGPYKTLTHGSILQRWLNDRGVHVLGDYAELTSRYNDPDGLEIWFDYHSSLKQYPELECHRIGETAFSDDLGQRYHGFLDFSGRYVGVYLPGYDHAARRIVCAVHWMPRQPGSEGPVSSPMAFTVDLPPARRLLPPAANLPRESSSKTINGVSVTGSAATLSEARLNGLRRSQRDLTFHLKITGGDLVNGNVMAPGSWNFGRNSLPNVGRSPFSVRFPAPFEITDPYGTDLIGSANLIAPLHLPAPGAPAPTYRDTTWLAPVNGAGKGTDVIRLRFQVRPDRPGARLVPFDLLLPVQTGDEI